MSIISKGILAAVSTLILAGPALADTLKLGNEGNYPPFSITQTDGSLTGLEPNLAAALCDRLGKECDIRAMEFKALIPSLVTGKIDIIVSQLFPKPERLEATEFTEPVLENPEAWIIAADNTAEITPEWLDGKSIGIIKGAWNIPLVKEYAPGATLKQYDNISGIRLDLDAGRIDIGTAGRLSALRSVIDAEGGENWRLVSPDDDKISGSEAYSWAVQKGNTELRDRVNAALGELFADCTYSNIRKEFFSEATSSREPESCQ